MFSDGQPRKGEVVISAATGAAAPGCSGTVNAAD